MKASESLPIEMREPVDTEIFRYAYQIACSVSTGGMPSENPSIKSFYIHNEDRTIDEIRFTDTPLNRILCELSKHLSDCGQPSSVYMRVVWRILESWKLAENKKFSYWIEHNEGSSSFHPDLIDAMATCRLTKKGAWPVKRILRMLEAS